MTGIWQDIRYSVRMLLKSPGFTAAVVLSLALGIGANAAVFSIVQAVLLRPLPYTDPQSLYAIWEMFPLPGGRGRGDVSIPNFEDWREQNTVFEDLAAYTQSSLNLSGGDSPVRLAAARVTEATFQLLDVAPLHGRYLQPSDFEPVNSNVALLSHRLWQEQFAGDPGAVGRTVKLNGLDHQIVGVMPPGFSFPPRSNRDIWKPLTFGENKAATRGNHWLNVFGRLEPDVSPEQAQAEMNLIAERLAQRYPEEQEDRGVELASLPKEIVGESRPVLLALWGAVGLVLLIACGNVANLLLARFSARRREFAVRNALGAGSRRIVRQLLTESLLLAVVGGALGLLLCYWTVPLLAELPGVGAVSGPIGVDLGVFGFCLLASFAAALIGGAVPALRTANTSPQQDLKSGGGGSGRDPARDALRSGLVVAEIALAAAVVVGAGLLLESYQRLTSVDAGLRTENVLTLRIPVMADRYSDADALQAFYGSVLERVEALPGVLAAGVTQVLPIQSWGWNGHFAIRGRTYETVREEPFGEFRRISPGYFQALGIPLVAGRGLNEQDINDERRNVVINAELARQYWPNEDPIGRQVGQGRPGEEDWHTVVGVVGSIRNAGFRNPPRGILYFPYSLFSDRELTLAVRTSGDPQSMTAAIRNEIEKLDSEQPIYRVATMEQVIDRHLATDRFSAQLFGAFGALATLLAVAGVYGLIAYSVSRRTREIGIRMALGALRRDVLALILRQGLKLAALGCAAGLVLAFTLGRFLESLLYEVTPTDPGVYALAAGFLIAVAAAAAYLPARRAARLEPMNALRQE